MTDIPFPIRRGFVDAPWGQIHYREAGPPGAQALVFLHQTALSGKSWEPVIPAFASDFHVLAPDTPGYGDSTRPETRPGLDWYVGALVAFLDAKGIGRAAFVGHHTGASLAAALATRHPERVSHVVLSMPPLFTDGESARYAQLGPEEELAAEGHVIRSWQARVASLPQRVDFELTYWDYVEGLRAWPHGPWAIQALAEADLGADLRGVRCPLLVLHNPTDALVRHRERIMEVIPNARFELVETTTVDVFIERAGVVAPMIRDFVRS
jgi:pimeloyl-ACP methyl ester carboxylesterase